MKKILSLVALSAASSAAMAEVPADALATISGGLADINTVGWAFFGLFVAAAVFKYFRRAG